MLTMQEAASVFLANKRIAVTGVSRKPKEHGANTVFKRLLPVMEPTRSDPILPNFQNYRELWE